MAKQQPQPPKKERRIIPVTVYMERDVAEAIDAEGRASFRSRSQMVSALVNEALSARQEAKKRSAIPA